MKESEHTGVWFLKNKEYLDEDGFGEPNEVFVTEVPTKFHDDPKVIKAKEDELKKWREYEAYEEVACDDQHIITARWVVTEKEDGRVKARLCVRGFQEKDYPQSDSPTAQKESMKIFLAVAANEGYKIKTLDVTSAFLQGCSLKREVFVQPPPECQKDGLIWKLKKSCYGLYDASR